MAMCTSPTTDWCSFLTFTPTRPATSRSVEPVKPFLFIFCFVPSSLGAARAHKSSCEIRIILSLIFLPLRLYTCTCSFVVDGLCLCVCVGRRVQAYPFQIPVYVLVAVKLVDAGCVIAVQTKTLRSMKFTFKVTIFVLYPLFTTLSNVLDVIVIPITISISQSPRHVSCTDLSHQC